MQIEDLKTWHWVVAGLLVGLLFSSVRMWQGPAFANYAINTIDVGEFEHQAYAGTKFGSSYGAEAYLINQYHKGLPLLKDVVVHPPLKDGPGDRYWVTGRAYTVGSRSVDPTKVGSPQHVVEEWVGFKYSAATPYLPGYALREEQMSTGKAGFNFWTQPRNRQLAELKKTLGDKESFPTVLDYLKTVKAVPGSQLSYSYAWYELPAAVWSLPPLAGLLLIGIAWPLTLSVMQNTGMARPARIVKQPKPAKQSKAPRPAQPPMPANAGVVFKPAEVPVPVATEAERKKYGGEFYPVVKVAHKD